MIVVLVAMTVIRNNLFDCQRMPLSRYVTMSVPWANACRYYLNVNTVQVNNWVDCQIGCDYAHWLCLVLAKLSGALCKDCTYSCYSCKIGACVTDFISLCRARRVASCSDLNHVLVTCTSYSNEFIILLTLCMHVTAIEKTKLSVYVNHHHLVFSVMECLSVVIVVSRVVSPCTC